MSQAECEVVNDVLLVQVELPRDGEQQDDPDAVKVILFECHFMGKYIKYYPEMFINICHNFLLADQQLRRDIELLLEIAEQVNHFNRANSQYLHRETTQV